ncbi:MAG TPA: alpha/beta hydrolase-fold protein, partial [Polyangiaceae bacterium]|nr:alpha/beta hydrolase-fold protein [Polyangiaceae bacterium]
FLHGPCAAIADFASNHRPRTSSACSSASWRTISSPSGDFDWAETLDAAAGNPAAALAWTKLTVEERFDGWLFVAADGGLRVAVDGRWIHRREKPRQRGRGYVPIPISLEAGVHTIALALSRFGNRSRFSVLVRDKSTNESPETALLHSGLPERSVLEQLSSLSVRVRELGGAFQLELELAYPAGGVAQDFPIELDLRSVSGVRHFKPGVVEAKNVLRTPFTVRLGPLEQLVTEDLSSVVVRLGAAESRHPLWLTPQVLSSLERGRLAKVQLAQSAASNQARDALSATLQARLDQVLERMLQVDREPLEAAVKQLDQFISELERGKNPFAGPGLVEAFLVSPFDGRPTQVMIHVPEQAAEQKPLPLVLALHGYNGNPRKILDAFLDTKNQLAAKVSGFVLAPAAYGNTFYRGPGEHAVIDALDWAKSMYRVDTTRISITGVSMGGTGAAEIALHHPQLFAAAAPLCGYQSYFVRRDTAGKPLRPWERRLMHVSSPASHAENGDDVPLYVAHGTKDLPLENSRVLTSRYRKLGYRLTEDWPNLGHAVWTKTYHGAAMFSWLSQWQKELDPTRVVFTTASLAYPKKFWLELTELEPRQEPSLIEGSVLNPGEVKITTRGVAAFRIGLSRHLPPNQPMIVLVDGDRIDLAVGEPPQFRRINGVWRRDEASTELRQQPQVGPWSELFARPFAVVYGSGNPRAEALNRELAIRLTEPRPGVDLRVPVLSDQEFDPHASGFTRVLYVGTPVDHRQLASLAPQLPLHWTTDGLELGGIRFTESDVGAAFVYPDLDHPGRLLGVVTANGPEGFWRVLALPALLPDFVVFDHGTDAAAGEPVLGSDAYLRAAGFFRSDWSLPEELRDPLEVRPR